VNSDVAREYDRLANRFADWRPSRHFEAIFEETVLATVGGYSGSGLNLLDAGCGHGTWLGRVLDFAAANQIDIAATGVDISERRIAIARSQIGLRTGLTLLCGDLGQVPLARPLDIVYSAEVFQHLSDRLQVDLLRRWLDVLKPGGAVIVIDKDRRSVHSIKAEVQKRTGRIGRRLLGIFPEDYARLFATIRYPSFTHMVRAGKEIGFRANPLLRAGEFTAMKLVKPALASSINQPSSIKEEAGNYHTDAIA
jgi:SAM-dependent methyltransferase